MDFKEWQEINDGLCMSSREYAEAAWNASREQAMNECVEVVEKEYIGVSEQYEQDGFDLANKLKDLKLVI